MQNLFLKLKKTTVFIFVLAIGLSQLTFVGCEKKSTPKAEDPPIENPYEDEDYQISQLFSFNSINIEGIDGYQIFRYKGTSSEVNIPDIYRKKPVISITESAFSENNITSVNIGKNVKIINFKAFFNCSLLETVTFSEGSTVSKIMGSVFEECTSLISVEIPSTITEIGACLFYGCTSLETVTLPEGLTELSNWLFSHSGITNLVVPNSVTTINANALDRCPNLTTLTLPSNVTIDNFVFDETQNLTTIRIVGTEGITQLCERLVEMFLGYFVPLAENITLVVDDDATRVFLLELNEDTETTTGWNFFDIIVAE